MPCLMQIMKQLRDYNLLRLIYWYLLVYWFILNEWESALGALKKSYKILLIVYHFQATAKLKHISFELWACMACRLGFLGSINRRLLLFALFFALFFLCSFFSMGTVVHVGIVGQIVLSTWVWFVFFDPKLGLICWLCIYLSIVW